MADFQPKQWDLVAADVDFSSAVDFEAFFSRQKPEDRILDYGCGYGRVACSLVDSGYSNVVGYDTSPAMIARGNRDYPDLELKLSSSLELAEADGSFSAAIVAGLFTSITEAATRELVVAELSRVLMPGGLLFLSEFARDSERPYDDHGCFLSSLGVRMKHFYSAELTELLGNWEIIELAEQLFLSVGGAKVPGFQLVARTDT